MLDGHPQVYCRVIGDILLENNASLIILSKDIGDTAKKWPDLLPFTKNDKVKLISTLDYCDCEDGYLKVEQLRQLQLDYVVDSTLFIWPEYFREEIIRISRGDVERLRGHNVGIFGWTTQWYPNEERYSGKKIKIMDSSLRQMLGVIGRRVNRPWAIDKYFFEQTIINNRILDTVLVKDERLAGKKPDLVRWMPEIYKVFYEQSESPDDDGEFDFHAPRLREYLKNIDPDDVVLFFGAGAWYKGYDHFLKFMASDSNVIGIHAGSGIRHEKNKDFIGTPKRTRDSLLALGRLYETAQYVESPKLIKLVFESTRRFISTHRLTLSSGTILQAMDYGLPVLVPDSGLVGYRARKNNLGATYKYGDVEDMVRQWNKFKNTPVEQYAPSIKEFMGRFSRENLNKLFIDVLLEFD